MTRLLRAALAIFPLVALLAACDAPKEPTRGERRSVAELSVEQLASLLASAKPPAVFDANSKETRSEFGLIPGATPLPSRKFDAQAVLPASKDDKVVFYCGSLRCKSAEGAANRAVAAGYRDVAVLPAGIRGWKKAGMETRPYASSGT